MDTIELIKRAKLGDRAARDQVVTDNVGLVWSIVRRFLGRGHEAEDLYQIGCIGSLKETAMKVRTARDELEKRFGREPTIEEIGEELAITREEIVLALESGAEVESLFKTIYQGDGNAIYLIDKLEQTRDENESMLNRCALREVFAKLNEKEQTIIRMRYFEERTQTEVAERLGISQVQVSRLEKKILLAMREKMM